MHRERVIKTSNYIWEVENSPYPSSFLQHTITFGEENPVFLIDQLSGKRPAILNKQFLTEGTISFGLYPSALLDSNVLDLVDKFVQKKETTDGFSAFLKFLTEKGWDFSPMFYYMEHYAKSSLENFLPNAIRRTESIMTLHSMNEKHFLETGKIIPNPEAVNHYIEQYGVTTLKDAAKKRVESFVSSYNKEALTQMLESIEVALMKMVLIRKSSMAKSTSVDQYKGFIQFLQNDLEIILGREAHLALHYFCDNAGKLLGIQSTTPYKKALSIIKSTSWDLYLLRMPEILFESSPNEMCIAYIATQEKRLQQLARLYTVERIICSDDKGIVPFISYNLRDIPEAIQSQLPTSMPQKKGEEFKSIPNGLYQELQDELKHFCA